MGTSESVKTLTGVAGEDFTGDLYKCLKRSSGSLVVNDTAQGEVAGILAEESSVVGEAVPYIDLNGGGVAPVLCGANISQDARVASGTDGRLVAHGSTAGDFSIGIALEAGVAGEVIRVKLEPMVAAGS